MKIKYDILCQEMNTIQGVFNKTAGNNAKVVYFHDNNIIGYSPLMMCKSKLDVEEEFFNCSLSFDSLSKILAGFSNLFFTKVEEVEINQVGSAIKITIHEMPKDDKPETKSFAKTSEFILDNIPVAQSIIETFNREIPENSESVTSEEFDKYIKTLYPLLSNDASGSGAGKLNFAEDYVFFLSNMFSSFVKNTLPDSFKDVEISQSGLSLIKKIFERIEVLNVGKDNGYLVISSLDESLCCFIRINKVTFKYAKIIEAMKKEKGIVLNRKYFREVLNRLSNFSEQVVVKYSNEEIFVDAKHFNQNVPLINTKGDLTNLGFSANTNILNKLIIGQDDLMSSDVFFYFITRDRNISLYLSDSTGEWLSVTTVMSA